MPSDPTMHPTASESSSAELRWPAPEAPLLEDLCTALLGSDRPSVALERLRCAGALRSAPELEALVGVEQDPEWHPEGDVWTHTLMVVDEAAALRDGGAGDLALMLAALCHDVGKPATTVRDRGRLRSPEHERVGGDIAERLLARLGAPRELSREVKALVSRHLAPTLLFKQGSSMRAYRRLARELAAAGSTMVLLERLARADHLGRDTPAARERTYPAGEAFLARGPLAGRPAR